MISKLLFQGLPSVFFAFGISLTASYATAQTESYPQRSVRIVVPVSAGAAQIKSPASSLKN